MPVTIGSHADYECLSAELDLTEFLKACPDVALDRYLAVTSQDSGAKALNEFEKAEGWIEIGEIAFSPRIQRLPDAPNPQCCNFNEWYLFNAPVRELGRISRGNVFESKLEPGQVFTFVSYYLFLPGRDDITKLFWKQVDWIRPESYLSDTQNHLTFVTRNRELFENVRAKLESI